MGAIAPPNRGKKHYCTPQNPVHGCNFQKPNFLVDKIFGKAKTSEKVSEHPAEPILLEMNLIKYKAAEFSEDIFYKLYYIQHSGIDYDTSGVFYVTKVIGWFFCVLCFL